MSRRTVTIVVILAVIAFGALYFWPNRAHAGLDGLGVGVRLDGGNASVRLGFRVGEPFRHGFHHHDGLPHRHHVRAGGRRTLPRERNPQLIVPFGFDDDDDDTIIVLPPSDPPATPVAAPPEPPQPLDPYGRARTVSAPGAAGPREWELGAVLPDDLPHVTLDPAAYGLPEPPPGQIYARVAGDVLRIDAGTRQIRAVLAR